MMTVVIGIFVQVVKYVRIHLTDQFVNAHKDLRKISHKNFVSISTNVKDLILVRLVIRVPILLEALNVPVNVD